MKIFTLLAVLLCFAGTLSAEASEYAVALIPTPILNTADFKGVFGGPGGADLKMDRCGQVRELEHIALPGSVFKILKKMRSGSADIYQVETDEYTAPPNVRLYVDSRFLMLQNTAPSPRQRSLPPREEILSVLASSVGSRYVWGGNAPDGVPELSTWFFRDGREADRDRNRLTGLDCSGLLYHATGGWTPRNTSQLLSYGQGVTIEGKASTEIAAALQPLDLIVWNGHVVIVLDRHTAIESRLECGKPGNGGVVMTPLPQRLAVIMRNRQPVNAWPDAKKSHNVFVVRRWYDLQKTISGDNKINR